MRRPAKPEPHPEAGSERAARTVALEQLARRDFGRVELRERLLGKGFEAAVVEGVLEQLTAERLLSDERYVASALRSHAGKGHGPARVRAVLRQRGLESGVVDTALREADTDWAALAGRLRRRRFGAAPPTNARERAKQARFLQYRGFTADQIRAAFGADPELDDSLPEAGADPSD